MPGAVYSFSSSTLHLPLGRRGFPGSARGKKNPPSSAGHVERDIGSIPGLGKSHGEGNGNLFQYSCLEHPVNRGAWSATVHRAAKRRA